MKKDGKETIIDLNVGEYEIKSSKKVVHPYKKKARICITALVVYFGLCIVIGAFIIKKNNVFEDYAALSKRDNVVAYQQSNTQFGIEDICLYPTYKEILSMEKLNFVGINGTVLTITEQGFLLLQDSESHYYLLKGNTRIVEESAVKEGDVIFGYGVFQEILELSWETDGVDEILNLYPISLSDSTLFVPNISLYKIEVCE